MSNAPSPETQVDGAARPAYKRGAPGDAGAGETMSSAKSLLELLRSPDPAVDHAALLLARDEYPELAVGDYLGRLDDLAAPLRRRVARVENARDQAAVLGAYVYDELGFRGNESAYYDPRNSYLNEVIELRLGIPITLAVMLIALGRRAGLLVEGVGFPGHFLVRLGGTGGLYLDPFFDARVLPVEALEGLAKRVLGESAKLLPEHLAPATTHAMVIRMLSNLKGIHVARNDHARALVVCDRLVDLGAGVEIQRDRGLHAFALGAFEGAAEDLETYLGARPGAADEASVRDTIQSARARSKAGLN